eukprot:49801_1
MPNPYTAAYSVIAIGSLHLLLACRMSLGFRIPIGLEAMKVQKAKKNNEEYDKDKLIAKSTAFKVASKVQLNIAEYSGVFIPILLYIQSEVNRGNQLSKIGLFSIYGAVIGSYMFAIGYSLVKKLQDTNVLKVIGATMRYFAIAGLLYEVYALTKTKY